MALTITAQKVQTRRLTGMRIQEGLMSFDSSYPTNGETVSGLSLSEVRGMIIEPMGGYLFEYDRTSNKVKVFGLTGGSGTPSATAAATVLVQVAVPFAGIQGTITAEETKYIGPVDNAENAKEDIAFVAPLAGKIKGILAALGTAPGAADEDEKTITLTVRKNGADQAVTCAIAADATEGSDTEHEFAVAAGDKITVKSVSAAATTAADLNLTLLYEVSAATAAVPTANHTHAGAAIAEVADGTNLSSLANIPFLAWGW